MFLACGSSPCGKDSECYITLDEPFKQKCKCLYGTKRLDGTCPEEGKGM